MGFLNSSMGEKELLALIATCYKDKGPSVTVKMLDAVKDLGFRYATRFGATIGMDDIVIPGAKKALIKEANSRVDEIQRQYLQGHITNEERYNRVIEVWSSTNELVTNELMDELKKDKDGFNPVYMMAHSGARGSRSQIRQLAGMRGLMAKPSGDIIELPIRSNFKEGLSVIEFFISTNGARKGLADTALKTADAGYLTRRLVDIAQDVVIAEHGLRHDQRHRAARHQGRGGHRRVPRRPDRRALLPREGEAPHHRRDHRRRERGDHRRDRPGDRGGGHRGRAHPLGPDLRLEVRRVRALLRAQPRHLQAHRDRRGGRHHRRAVHRAARHAAHDAHVPHRRGGDEDQRGEPHLPQVPRVRRAGSRAAP